MTNCRQTVLKVKFEVQVKAKVDVDEVLFAWHARLEGYSGCMYGWMIRLQEIGIKREDICFGGAPGTVDSFGGAAGTVDYLGGASGKLYLCFL
jgi:hypothetical protein